MYFIVSVCVCVCQAENFWPVQGSTVYCKKKKKKGFSVYSKTFWFSMFYQTLNEFCYQFIYYVLQNRVHFKVDKLEKIKWSQKRRNIIKSC